MLKVVIADFLQETNSFNPIITDMDFWEKSGIYEGENVFELEGKPISFAGIIKGLREDKNVEIIPSIRMACQSGGPCDPSVLDYFLNKLTNVIKKNLPLDGVFLSLHGALQTLKHDDAEGFILEKIREVVGPETVISIATDLHAYISDTMLKHADIVCAYHKYPHTDRFETGYRAAKLGIDCITSKVKPKMVNVKLPILAPAGAYNTISGPFKDFMDCNHKLVKDGSIFDFSVCMIQPWLDVAEGQSSVIVIANDLATAENHAIEIAENLFKLRENFLLKQFSIDEVIEKAERNETDKPVILVDSADSSDAGAAGDSMAVVDRLIKKDSLLKAATVVNDIPAVELAFKVGVGGKAIFSIGGTRDPKAPSIKAEGYVKSLHDGEYIEEGPRRGMVNNIGPTAVIRIKNTDIVVCHWMHFTGDPQLYRSFGIEPTLYQLIVVKACTSFRAAYDFTDLIYQTETPGAAAANLKNLNYKKLPTSKFFPWTSLDDYTINEIVYGRN